MEEQLKKSLASLKEFWAKQPKKKKTIIVAAAAAIVLMSLGMVVYMSGQGGQFVTLYTNLDRQEATSVYTMLQDMEVPAQMDNSGNVLVSKEQVETVRLELAAKGYPKTGLSYDVFSSSSGLTTTESDKQVILVQQLETRMQDTLIRIDGVQKAVVTLNLSQGGNYVWEQDTQKNTAGVLLTLNPDVSLSKSQIAGIKTLIAGGLPKMSPDDVKVVDAATSIELTMEDPEVGGLSGELERIGFERQIEKGLEDKAYRQLSLFYPADMMRVSATVVINYDKMLSESMQYKPEQGGVGVVDELNEQYAMSPNSLASGIAGEENNTDTIPIYVDENGDGVPEYIDHTRSIDYAVSYIKSQVEKGKAELTSSSIAVMVKDGDLNQQKKDSIIEQISKATNIPIGSISVETLEVAPPEKEKTDTVPSILDDPVMLAVIGLGALSLIIIIFMISKMFGKKKKRNMSLQEVDELALEQQRLQQEMDEKKRLLKEAADAKNNQENAIANEVRTFARENPEITAGLIRSWLKEDE